MAQYFASGNGNIKYYRTFANQKYTDRFMKQIILITGGASFRAKAAMPNAWRYPSLPNPVYLATLTYLGRRISSKGIAPSSQPRTGMDQYRGRKELSRHSLRGV